METSLIIISAGRELNPPPLSCGAYPEAGGGESDAEPPPQIARPPRVWIPPRPHVLDIFPHSSTFPSAVGERERDEAAGWRGDERRDYVREPQRRGDERRWEERRWDEKERRGGWRRREGEHTPGCILHRSRTPYILIKISTLGPTNPCSLQNIAVALPQWSPPPLLSFKWFLLN